MNNNKLDHKKSADLVLFDASRKHTIKIFHANLVERLTFTPKVDWFAWDKQVSPELDSAKSASLSLFVPHTENAPINHPNG